MRDRPYDDELFKELTGRRIKKLWKRYKEYLGQPGDPEKSTEP